METMQLHSRIGPDGVLHLSIPFEPADANADVLVTIEPVATKGYSNWGDMLSENFGTSQGAGRSTRDAPVRAD